jgi:hypothetical protein
MKDNEVQRQHDMAIEDKRNQIRAAEIASREGLTIQQMRDKYGLEMAKQDREDKRTELKERMATQRFNAELVTKAQHGSGI